MDLLKLNRIKKTKHKQNKDLISRTGRSFILYEVVYMKADFEPWWLFEGWEEHILTRELFHSKNEAELYLKASVLKLRERYTKEKRKNPYFYAFWSNEEQCFCDSCDEDLQIFHGLLMLFNGEPLK